MREDLGDGVQPIGGGPEGRAKATPGGAVRDLRAFRKALLDHFDARKRSLPWRTGRTPYRVLVAEVMLQQTRVETVVPYFERWLQRFPDWQTLADASPDDVSLAWKSLGYYARARRLHRAARLVCEEHGGRLPDSACALAALPGIGEYTAAAVASIAFGEPVAAVDGNVRRVVARLFDIEAPTPARVRAAAALLLSPDRPGDHNEAMMELGATLCTPRSPRCSECPVTAWCGARRAGTVEHRPLPAPTRRPRPVHFASVVAVGSGGAVLLVRRPARGLLAGLWEFPSVEIESETSAASAAVERLRELGVDGLLPESVQRLAPVRHAYTHLRATYHPVIARCTVSGAGAPTSALRASADMAWVRHADLDDWPLPVAQQKVAALLPANLHPPARR